MAYRIRSTNRSFRTTATLVVASFLGVAESSAQTGTSKPGEPLLLDGTQAGDAIKAEDVERRTLSLNDASRTSSEERKSLTVTTTGQWNCCTVSGDTRQPWATGQSKGPRSIGASVSFTGNNSSLKVGVVGTGDYRYPLFMTTPLAGTETPTPALWSLTDVSRARMSWQVVGSAQKTLATSKSGKTLGVAADVFVPVGPEVANDVPHNPVLGGRAVRFGVTFGF